MRNFIFTLALLILAACGGDETSEQYLSRAKGYIAESDYPSATIELQNALKLDGASAEARWLLGKIYLDTGDILAAEKELQRAQDLGWKADDVRPALAIADCWPRVNSTMYSSWITRTSIPQRPPGCWPAQALAQLAQGQIDSAHELVALALDKEPQSVEAKLAQATIFIQQDDTTAALACH